MHAGCGVALQRPVPAGLTAKTHIRFPTKPAQS